MVIGRHGVSGPSVRPSAERPGTSTDSDRVPTQHQKGMETNAKATLMTGEIATPSVQVGGVRDLLL